MGVVRSQLSRLALKSPLTVPCSKGPDQRTIAIGDVLDRHVDDDRRRLRRPFRRRLHVHTPVARIERDLVEADRVRTWVHHAGDRFAVELEHQRDIVTFLRVRSPRPVPGADQRVTFLGQHDRPEAGAGTGSMSSSATFQAAVASSSPQLRVIAFVVLTGVLVHLSARRPVPVGIGPWHREAAGPRPGVHLRDRRPSLRISVCRNPDAKSAPSGAAHPCAGVRRGGTRTSRCTGWIPRPGYRPPTCRSNSRSRSESHRSRRGSAAAGHPGR